MKTELDSELIEAKKALKEAEGARDSLQEALSQHEEMVESLQKQLNDHSAMAEKGKRIAEVDLPELVARKRALKREVSERSSELSASQRENESLRADNATLTVSLTDARQAFQSRLETLMQQVSELAAVANLSAIDRDSPAVDLNIFKSTVSELIDEISNERQQRDKQYSDQVERLHKAFSDLRRRYTALLTGYRTLRYQAEDALATSTSSIDQEPIRFVHEDEIVSSLEENTENYSIEPDPGEIHVELATLRERCIQLQQKLYTASVQQGLNTYGESHTDALSKLKAENEQLRNELGGIVKTNDDGSQEDSIGDPVESPTQDGTAAAEIENLRRKLNEIEDMDKTRASIGYELAETKKELEELKASYSESSSSAGASKVSQEEMAKIEKEFKAYMAQVGAEYEAEITRLKSESIEQEERANAAEEYMSQSTVAYQKEIMRLRSLLMEHAPETLQ